MYVAQHICVISPLRLPPQLRGDVVEKSQIMGNPFTTSFELRPSVSARNDKKDSYAT